VRSIIFAEVSFLDMAVSARKRAEETTAAYQDPTGIHPGNANATDADGSVPVFPFVGSTIAVDTCAEL